MVNNQQLSCLVYHTLISATSSIKVTIQLPHKPMKAVEIEVSTDQDCSWHGDFVEVAKAIENTDDGSYAQSFNLARIQGDVRLVAPTSDSYFLLQSDPTINLTNNSASEAKLFVKVIYRRD